MVSEERKFTLQSAVLDPPERGIVLVEHALEPLELKKSRTGEVGAPDPFCILTFASIRFIFWPVARKVLFQYPRDDAGTETQALFVGL